MHRACVWTIGQVDRCHAAYRDILGELQLDRSMTQFPTRILTHQTAYIPVYTYRSNLCYSAACKKFANGENEEGICFVRNWLDDSAEKFIEEKEKELGGGGGKRYVRWLVFNLHAYLGYSTVRDNGDEKFRRLRWNF